MSESLDKIVNGKEVVVENIEGGWGIRQKLNQMGIHIGDSILIKSRGFLGGPTLIQVHGTKVAIGRGMAKKVIVKNEAAKE